MYHPTTRLLTVLELLQSRERVGGGELSRRLEVTPRSVRRYIQQLQDLGIPVQAERGPGGGYRLRSGFKLPPLMFTDDEAVALTLALLAVPRLGLALDAPAAAGALAKVERVLPAAVRERVRAVQERVALDPAPGGTTDGGLVVRLSEAAQRGERVWLRYRSGASKEEETEREVDPYGVVCWSRHWYLVGWCHLRRGERLFRLDRAREVEPRPGRFAPPVGFDLLGFAVRSIAAMPGRWDVEVELGLSPEEAARRLPAAFGAWSPAANRGVDFRCRADDLDAVARMLVGFGCRFAVQRPPELREALRRLADEVAVLADDSLAAT